MLNHKISHQICQISKIPEKDEESQIKLSVNIDNLLPQDRDDSFSDDESEEEEKNEENGDSETEELMKEFEKIKKMREEEKKVKEKDETEKLKQMTQEQILLENPLLNISSYSLKNKNNLE